MPKVQGRDALEIRARKIVEALGGTWSRSRGMCCCPAHADRTPSLSITLGKRAVLVHCFAGCNNEAVMQGMAKRGVRLSDLFGAKGEPVSPKLRDEIADRNALRLWSEASILAGSPAERYLLGRGITVASPDLRFHPLMPLGPKGAVRFLPALVSAVRNDAGVLALHRTFLDSENDRLAAFEHRSRASVFGDRITGFGANEPGAFLVALQTWPGMAASEAAGGKIVARALGIEPGAVVKVIGDRRDAGLKRHGAARGAAIDGIAGVAGRLVARGRAAAGRQPCSVQTRLTARSIRPRSVSVTRARA